MNIRKSVIKFMIGLTVIVGVGVWLASSASAVLSFRPISKNGQVRVLGSATNSNFEGLIRAPEFPTGLSWLNTSIPLALNDLKGKFVLLDFWTFCCINCMHIIPDLKRLEAEYPNNLVVIGVHSAKFSNEKDTVSIRNAVMRYEVQHPVVNDSAFEIWSSYGVRAWPTLVLINPNGYVIKVHSGEGPYLPIDELLKEAIPYFRQKGQLNEVPFKYAAGRVVSSSGLSFPGKVAVDAKNDRLLISDTNHNRILVTG
ncbi:hypothetical protein EBR96_01965, partial [bacterium]|nr:hypothetical protein [bacterium]